MDGKRKFTRVPFLIKAAIDFQGEEIIGDVDNLSLRGLYVRTPTPIAVGEELPLCLTLSGTSPKISFWLRGRVSRATAGGLGIEIVETDLPAFIHLRNIVSLNVEDADQVLLELQQPGEPL